MSNHEIASSWEVTFIPEHSSSTKRIWRVFWVLLIITVVEVGLGLMLYMTDMLHGAAYFLKGVIVILGLTKAFYIISYFMHLGDERRNFVVTFITPVLFLAWAILALVIDGEASLERKQKMDVYYNTQTQKIETVPKTKHLAEQMRNKAKHH